MQKIQPRYFNTIFIYFIWYFSKGTPRRKKRREKDEKNACSSQKGGPACVSILPKAVLLRVRNGHGASADQLYYSSIKQACNGRHRINHPSIMHGAAAEWDLSSLNWELRLVSGDERHFIRPPRSRSVSGDRHSSATPWAQVSFVYVVRQHTWICFHCNCVLVGAAVYLCARVCACMHVCAGLRVCVF